MSIPSQHHTFDIQLAAQYGIEEAILIHHFQHWIRINRRLNRNIRDGSCWTYQSRKEIEAHFPYWNYDRIRRLCERLVKVRILKTANYNKSKIDKTLWYAFVEEKMFGVDDQNSNNFYERQNCPSSGKSAFPKGKSATPIPDTITDTTTEETVCIAPAGASQIDKKKLKEIEKKKIEETALKGSKMPSECSKPHPDGHNQDIRLQDIFEASVRKRKDWSTDEIHDAWQILLDYQGYVRDPLRFLEGTITNLRNFKRSDYLNKNKKESRWQQTYKSNNSNQNSSEKDTEELVCLGSLLEQRARERSQNGLKEGRTS